MKTIQAPPMPLVDDETLAIKFHGRVERFRLRIWRATGETAVVLVAAVPGSIAPHCCTEKLVNHVKAAYLAHAATGMYYFEQEKEHLNGVSFDAIGHGERCRLVRPSYTHVGANFVAQLVGHDLED